MEKEWPVMSKGIAKRYSSFAKMVYVLMVKHSECNRTECGNRYNIDRCFACYLKNHNQYFIKGSDKPIDEMKVKNN